MKLEYKGHLRTSDFKVHYYKFQESDGSMYYTKKLESDQTVFYGSSAGVEGGGVPVGNLKIVDKEYFLMPNPYLVTTGPRV